MSYSQITERHEHCLHVENLLFRLLVPQKDPYHLMDSAALTMHNHVSTEIFACGKGHLSIRFSHGLLTLCEGDAAIIPSGLLHHSCPLPANSRANDVTFMCRRVMQREGTDGIDLYRKLQPFVEGDHVILFRHCPNIYERLKKVCDEAEAPPHALSPALPMIDLLLSCTQLPYQRLSMTEIDAHAAYQTSDIHRIMALDNLIGEFQKHDLRAEDIASYLFISTRQLDRIVRRRYGKTLHAVITDRRIDAAEQLLRTTMLTADKVGESVGFSSRSGFYREFSRRYGMTPAAYRRSVQKKDVNTPIPHPKEA